jgi:LPPG:FO 2-phospho-L-lactate transferase
LRRGASLSEATAHLVAAAGLTARLLPVTDDAVRTMVETPAGTFPFQEWFVARRHADEVDRVHYEGIDAAEPAVGVLEALDCAERIVLAPSNPYVSLLPILRVPGVSQAVAARRVPSVAVSPLVAGRAVKGPLDRMLLRMAGDTTPAAIAAHYEGLVDALVVDPADTRHDAAVPLHATDILMPDREAARRVARFVLEASP